jgi:outer membrane protein OmpA-like peptidoglycan-associated protein
MAETLSGFSKKNNLDLRNTESFLKIRNSYAEEDDNTPWLITFADLMTILLVFSFVLFALNHEDDKTVSTRKHPSDTSTSLIPIAHSNTRNYNSYLTIPLYINDEASETGKSSDEEKIILKKSVCFDPRSATLTWALKSELNSMAKFSKKNTDAKIIVMADFESTSKLSIKRSMSIVDYFVDKCTIEKKKIFLQSLHEDPSTSTASYENISEDRPVEVKLIKAFWWF